METGEAKIQIWAAHLECSNTILAIYNRIHRNIMQ